MKNGKTISEEINVADAHPAGKRPFKRAQYIKKFISLTKNLITKKECDRFLKTVQNLKKLKSKDLKHLNIKLIPSKIKTKVKKGIF